MNILIVNDDGIFSPGIHKLAELAQHYGSVTVIAPDRECSAMSQKLTIFSPLELIPCPDFPVPGVKAFSLTGTPADCVKVAVSGIREPRPELVLSGINNGSNTGYDIAYSGTIGACQEAVMNGIPAIAFSTQAHRPFHDIEAYFPGIMDRILNDGIPGGCIINVNFPGCSAEAIKGIDWNSPTARRQMFLDVYEVTETDHGRLFRPHGILISPDKAPEDTDMWAVMHDRIAVSLLPTLANQYVKPI